MKQPLFWIAWSAIFLLACFLRFHDLENRPMHGDEANQAMKAEQLLEDGTYVYDPHEHHGPTLYYAARVAQAALGMETAEDTTKYSYRLVPVLFGVGILLILLLLRKDLGLGATFWAALFIAVSHAHVFYSRYFIQEILFLFFILLTLYAGSRYLKKPGIATALCFGAAAGLVHATKETSVLIYAAMGAGLFILFDLGLFYERRTRNPLDWIKQQTPTLLRHAPLMLLGFAIIVVVLFSAFFTNLRGPLDAFLTYVTYTERAEGVGSSADHDKAWYYYFQLLLWYQRPHSPFIWTEAVLFITGIFGMVWGFFRKTKSEEVQGVVYFHRFLSGFTLCLILLFSLIPYKTPWNLLPFYMPLLILAGIFTAQLGKSLIQGNGFKRILSGAFLVAILLGTAHHTQQTYKGITTYRADIRNPYVYAHTATALENKLIALIEDCTALHEDGTAMRIDVMIPSGDYWPLPWYLRKHSQVGYWVQPPPSFNAEIMICNNSTRDYVLGKVGKEYIVAIHSIRPEYPVYTFIKQELWDAYMAERR